MIPPTVHLTPHFTAGELGADNPAITAAQLGNVWRLAAYLEQVRLVAGGGRLKVTSGFRDVTDNDDVGGVITSDHLHGLAADIVPLDSTQRDMYGSIIAARDAGALGPFDQIIFYPRTGHVHIGIGSRMREEIRIERYKGPGGSPIITADTVDLLRGSSGVRPLFGSGGESADVGSWLVAGFAAALFLLFLFLA